MNLVINPNVDTDLALRRLYPSAVRVGLDVLREAGWITQVPSRPEVVVPLGEPIYALDDFSLATRPASWFKRVAPGLTLSDRGVSRLQPVWALADMLARAVDRRVRDAGLLDPDDVDFESAAADQDMPAALEAFGLDAAVLTPAGYLEIKEREINFPYLECVLR